MKVSGGWKLTARKHIALFCFLKDMYRFWGGGECKRMVKP